MAVNPAIAMGVQPLQLADPLTQYGRFAAIQQAQNQNALAQYQLGAARREEAANNALNEAYRAAYDPQTGAVDMNRLRQTLSTGGFGSKLPAIEKSMADMEEQRLKRDTAKTALVDVKLKQARSFLDTIDPADPTAPEKFMAWHEANHRDPVLGPVLEARGVTADQSRGRIQQAIQQGPQAFAQLLLQSKVGTEKFMEMNKPMVVAPGASVFQPGATAPAFTAPAAPPAPSEVVKLNRELAAANAAGDTALAADLKARITRLTEKPVGTTIVNKLPEQEKAERGERGKLLVAEYKVVSDAARLATRMLPALETQERVLDSGFRTGFGAEAQKAGASLLAALGVPEAEGYATNAQTFSAAMNQAVLQKQLEQKGVQTQADADRITQTGAQLTNTADANRFIIAVARAQLKRDIAQRNFYDKWWKENKTYDGAEDAWATGEGNKSLFEDPALRKFAPAPAAATPAAPPRKASSIQEQADAILRGSKK